MSGFRTQGEGTQGDARDVASVARRTICLVVMPKKRLDSDAAQQQRLKRLNPGQEILQLLSGTLPLPASGLAGSLPASQQSWELSGRGGSFP